MICFFNTIKKWGDGEKWHYEMAQELSKIDKILFVCDKDSEIAKRLNFSNKNIDIIFFTVRNFSFCNFNKIYQLTKVFLKYKVSTIVLNSSQDMKFGGLAAKKAHVKRIIYRRGSAIPIKNTIVNRYFFKNIVTEILANSLATKYTINQNNNNLFPKDKITVIPNGIDLSFLNQNYIELYKRKGSEIILGNLGRLVYQKNHVFLLKVAQELKSRKIDFKILIAGSGRLLEDLKQKSKALGVYDNLSFLGFIKNPKDFMMSIDVFVLPSHWEGFGYVLAEALLCEKPIVAFDISSNAQFVKHNENGFLVEYQNLKDFCDKITKFKEDLNLRHRFGKKGKSYIVDNFDKKDIKKLVIKYLINAN